MTTITDNESLRRILREHRAESAPATVLYTASVTDTIESLREFQSSTTENLPVIDLSKYEFYSELAARIDEISADVRFHAQLVVLTNMERADSYIVRNMLNILEFGGPVVGLPIPSEIDFVIVMDEVRDLDSGPHFEQPLPCYIVNVSPAKNERELTEDTKIMAAANEYALQLLGRRLECCEEQTQSSLKIQAAAILRAAGAIPATLAVPATV